MKDQLELIVSVNVWLTDRGERRYHVCFQDGFSRVGSGYVGCIDTLELATKQVTEIIEEKIREHKTYYPEVKENEK